ncbi:hypothetical protein MMC21_003305 [Puttea exsequens]|nr:hypothetical protein [Puttea exsequens]
MLGLFSASNKPPYPHGRSKIVTNFETLSKDAATPSGSITKVNGHHFDLLNPNSPTPRTRQGDPDWTLTEPTKSHQRSLTTCAVSNRELPPLFTKPTGSKPNLKHSTSEDSNSDHQTPFDEFHISPEHSRQSSPTRSHRQSHFVSDQSTEGKKREKVGRLADWFNGESEPVKIGIIPSPTKEKVDSLNVPAAYSEIQPTNLLHQKSTMQLPSKPALASRFSFFASKASLSKPTTASLNEKDDLLSIDVVSALKASDCNDLAALKEVQQSTERLLLKIQSAYKERTVALRDVLAEKEALSEEAEGAAIRAQHLKTQLDDMAAKKAEQDETMVNLVTELAQEKFARIEEAEARKRTVKLVDEKWPSPKDHQRLSSSSVASEFGFESEEESSAESVFSRRAGAHSPTMSISSVSTTSSPDATHVHDFSSVSRLRVPASLCMTKIQPAFQHQDVLEEPKTPTCTNCTGVKASEAWAVVGILKVENQALKHRVEELEGALDGCLDVVGRLGS